MKDWLLLYFSYDEDKPNLLLGDYDTKEKAEEESKKHNIMCFQIISKAEFLDWISENVK